MKKTLSIILALVMLLSVSSVGFSAFAANSYGDFYYTEEAEGIKISGYKGSGGAITIPSMINGKTVKAIKYCAFINNSNITSVTVPGNIKTIELQAFNNCYYLETVNLSYGLQEIGNDAFRNCANLETLTLPNSLKTIGKNAFNSCSKLSSVTIPQSCTVNEYAFSRSGVQSVTLSSSAVLAGTDTFYNCESLKTVTIEEGILNIPAYTFENCNSLETLYLDVNVKTIGTSAFYGCSALKYVYYNSTKANYDNISKTNGNTALNGATVYYENGDYRYTVDSNTCKIAKYLGNAANVNIPSSFENCPVKSVSGFYGMAAVKKVTVPEGVTKIESNAFKMCSSLESVSLPSSLTTIDSSAFSYCYALKDITIPSGVTSIGTFAFLGSSALSTLTLEGKDTPISSSALSGHKDGLVLRAHCKNESAQSRAESDSTLKLEKIHDYNSVVTKPTYTTKGYTTHTCKNCGDSYVDSYVNPLVKPASTLSDITNATGGAVTPEQVDKYVTSLPNDNDPKGTSFRFLLARQKKVTNNSITFTFKKPANAAYFVVYGNKCGAANKYQKLGRFTANTIVVSKLAKNTYYKFLICAFDKNGNFLGCSNTLHIATLGGKNGNPKAVTTKKKKLALKKGKSAKLGAKQTAPKKQKIKKHRAIRYESTNPAVATVSAKGVVKGKSKGSCIVYAYAQNGVYKAVKVTVK